MTTTTDEQLTIDEAREGLQPIRDRDPDAPAQPDTGPAPSRDAAAEPGPEPAKTTRTRKTTGKGRAARKPKPEKTEDGKPKTPPGVSAKGNRLSLAKDIEGLLAMLGMAVASFDQYDGAVIVANAGTTARKLDDLAKDNPAIHRTLAMLTQGSGGTMGVVFAMMPIVLPIMHHHGMTGDSKAIGELVAGMVPPDVQKLHTDAPPKPKPDSPATGPTAGQPVG